jgi:hypothetical protein
MTSNHNLDPALIHYSTKFDGRTPVLCRSEAPRTAAASDPRNVNCPACLALITPPQRAQREESVRRYG